jgi:hypothetical protein
VPGHDRRALEHQAGGARVLNQMDPIEQQPRAVGRW